MKTISAEIQSSTPVTISKAASVLSKFLSAETGASQAVNAYLRRATASLDELVRLHSKSHRKKHKKHKSESSAFTAAATSNGEIPTRSVEVSQGEGNLGEKKKKEKSGDLDEVRVGEEIVRKKNKKRRRTGESDVVGIEIGNGEVEKKRENREEENNIREHEENGVKIEIGEPKKEERKKRKNREVEEDGSRYEEVEEEQSKKKKRRRSGGEDGN